MCHGSVVESYEVQYLVDTQVEKVMTVSSAAAQCSLRPLSAATRYHVKVKVRMRERERERERQTGQTDRRMDGQKQRGQEQFLSLLRSPPFRHTAIQVQVSGHLW